MALRLEDNWIWDFWLAESAGVHHIFYLQAPKALGNPDLRHWNASIGHACSTDLTTWEVLPDALRPGEAGAWDDRSTWTGSIIEHDGRWHMFYTGTSTAERGLVQRIGLASSDDLSTWERSGRGPLLEADPRWYEKIDSGSWRDEAWRDPWVFRHEGRFHATITARANHGPRDGRGVVALARSDDLTDWEVLPPITDTDGFGQIEVSQLVGRDGDWYMLFCSDLPTQSRSRRRTGAGTGTYYVRSKSPLGPFRLAEAKPLSADMSGSSYAGRIVDRGDAGLSFLAWEFLDESGSFVGAIADPIPVGVDGAGDLQLDPS